MIAYKNLKDIINITIKWEEKLKDFYDVAEFALIDSESKKIVRVLRDNLLKDLNILKNVDVNSFGAISWVQYARDYKEEDLIPKKKITRNSTPEEIFTHILKYVENLRDFYSHIHDNISNDRQKELFKSLILFKDEQIHEINKFMKDQKI